jgi:hypothetical protein
MRRSVYIFYSFGGIPSIKRLKLLIKKRKQTNKEGKKTVRCNALAGCQISKYGCFYKSFCPFFASIKSKSPNFAN